VKVEPPGGDIGRRGRAGFGWAAYRAYNVGKSVVEVDVKEPRGRAELVELAAAADVFLHNAPPGRAERLGFDAPSLARVNPSLVHAHASGWGASGPTRIAGDFLVQAHAGCADGLTPAGEPPSPSRVTLLDVTGGLLACDAILAGLLLRQRDGCGCSAQTSLLAAAGVLQRDVRARIGPRRQAGRPLWGPLDEALRTVDGWLALDARGARARRRLAAACGLREAGDEALAEWLTRRPAAVGQVLLDAGGLDAAVVCEDLSALADDPHVGPSIDRLGDGCCVLRAPWRFGPA
jgi:crotonobetainyl-CoA:carnitine CoA-transferase CaiB-like acyl-CoA transferase